MMTMAKKAYSNTTLFLIFWCLVLRNGNLVPCTALVPLSSSPLSVPSSSSSLSLSFASTLAACPRPTTTHMLQQQRHHLRQTSSMGRQQSNWGEKDKSGSRTALMALPQQLLSPLSMSYLFQQLPTCTTSQVPTVALLAGMTGLVTQLSLSKFFRMSSHTAHTCVAFVFLLLVTMVGAIGWYSTGMVAAKSAAAASRLLVVQPAALWLAAVVTGMMALWDIPTSIRVKSLRKPDVLVHHILMTVISYLGATQVPTLYVFFHLGVSELSSLPLLLYDQLTHQLQGFENQSQDDHSTSREDDGDNQQEQQRRTAKLIQAQEVMKPVTAIFFTIVRAFWFTKVTLFGYVPDVLSVLRTNVATAAGKAAVLQFTMLAGIGFTALQLYWFYSQIVCTLLDTYKSAEIRE
jgi:hypothetical protein